METIRKPDLTDPTVVPDTKLLRSVLGASFPTYRRLLQIFLERDYTHEWRYYDDGKAWLCKVQKARRTIAWMSAWKGYAQVTVYFPEKHRHLLNTESISLALLDRIQHTRLVGKSQPCTLELRSDEALPDLISLFQLKERTR